MMNHTEETAVLFPSPDLQQQRYKEYAEKLPPIEDLNLSPAQLPFSQGKNPSLYLGFQCPCQWPDTTGSAGPGGFTKEFLKRRMQVNHEVDAAFKGELDWRLVHVFTVNDCPRDSDIVVMAFYINVHKKAKDDGQTKEKMRRVLEIFRDAFGEGVEGPKWYWGANEHGAGAYGYAPFDEAYPSGYPIATDTK